MIVYTAITIIVLLALLSGWFMYIRRETIYVTQQKLRQEPVSIIIPARNEADNLPSLLSTIPSTSNIEIIVMDDGFTDYTQAIAETHGANVFQVSQNATWQGKSHACWEGRQHASHELLLFVNSDVQFDRQDSIWRIIQCFHRQKYKGLLSIQPCHKIHRLYENFSAIFNLVTIVGMNKFSITRSTDDTKGAFGPVLLTNKQDYDQTGGHLNAKASVIEGFALSNAYQELHLPITLFEGQGIVSFRMYGDGLKALITGWSKHVALGAQVTKKSTLALIMIWLIGSYATLVNIILAIQMGLPYFILAIVIYALYTIQFHLLIRRTGCFSLLASIGHPLLFSCFLMIFLKSWIDVQVFKTIQWKDRKIDL